MTTPKDGGPAFPTACEQFLQGPQGLQPASAWGMEGAKGMSLRDWFAGQIIAKFAEPLLMKGAKSDGWTREGQLFQMAGDAYAIADAMLNEREK